MVQWTKFNKKMNNLMKGIQLHLWSGVILTVVISLSVFGFEELANIHFERWVWKLWFAVSLVLFFIGRGTYFPVAIMAWIAVYVATFGIKSQVMLTIVAAWLFECVVETLRLWRPDTVVLWNLVRTLLLLAAVVCTFVGAHEYGLAIILISSLVRSLEQTEYVFKHIKEITFELAYSCLRVVWIASLAMSIWA